MAPSSTPPAGINNSSTEKPNASASTSTNTNKEDGPDFPCTADLLRFYSTERKLFTRLTKPLKQDTEKCKVIMALWLWLAAVGHRGFMRQVHASSDMLVMQFFGEATICMECLLGHRILATMESIEIPLTSFLIEEPINLRFFIYHKDMVMKGLIYILDNVCRIIFDDDLLSAVAADISNPYNRLVMSSGFIKYRPAGRGHKGALAPDVGEPKDEGMEVDATSQPTPAAATVQGKAPVQRAPDANDGAAVPHTRVPPVRQPVEQRAAFITFARGQYIGKDEIAQFFNMRHAADGLCVEMVLIECDQSEQPPTFGTIVFTSASMMEIALSGQRSGKFHIDGRFLWVRVCKPPLQGSLVEGVRQGEAAVAN